MAIEIDYDDVGVSWREHELRQQHKRLLATTGACQGGYFDNGEGAVGHIYVGREDVIEGKCPMCEGPALIHVGYAWRDLICKDYICWRTFGTLHSG